MWEKIHGKCFFRSREKILEGMKGLGWPWNEAVHTARVSRFGPSVKYL